MNDLFWELITKYLSNEASEKDINAFFSLLESDKKYQIAFDETVKKWNQAVVLKKVPFSTDIARQKVIAEIRQEKKKSSKKIYFNFLAKAAAVLILIFSSYFIINTLVFVPPQWKEFTTAENEKLRVLLPDSSTVWLNENASLSYNFSDPKTRHIKLDGEVFFDVACNEKKPFIVSTRYFTTKVLGTRFNINSKNENNASVSVISGKVIVAINKNKEPLFLERGQKAVFDKKTQKIYKEQPLGIDNAMAWITQKFVFENLPLKEVLYYLSQNYEAIFHVANKNLNNCLITGTFHKESLKHILTVICTSLNCEYIRLENNIIKISGNGCQKEPEDTRTTSRLKTNN